MLDLVDYLQLAVERGASDLHLHVGTPPMARVHGQLQPVTGEAMDEDSTRTLILSVLKETQRAVLESEMELDFALQVEGLGRFRGNAHYIRGNIEATFRHIPESIPDLDSLGHSPTLNKFCKEKQGLILVTGITGSGKTTTLAAMTKLIAATIPGVIVTIEDPIEYVFENTYGIVKQRQVGSDTKTFSNALRSAMRQDPDVIVVSELRDLETVQTAISAAETGHLVIGTLHTLDAAKSIDRLVDVFPPAQQPFIIAQLANCLVGIVSQRLLPAKGGKGRVLASEVLVVNSGVRACIRDHKIEQIPGLMQIGAGDGMHTMDDSLSYLLEQDQIDSAEAIVQANDRKAMQILVNTIAQQKPKSTGWFKK